MTDPGRDDQAPATQWIDSHAHLTMFDHDEVADVVARAVVAGVGGVLVPATGPDDLATAQEIASRFSGRMVAALGVHPHDASRLDASMKRLIESGVSGDSVVAVGEIGLDYHYMSSPREDQLKALAWQLDLALETNLPVVLHNRESWTDLEADLVCRAGRLRGVCHSFTEGPAEAQRVVDLGLLIGISGMVTFKGAAGIRAMVASLRPQDLLVETDSPFLAPVPHRGRRNEPAYVVKVGEGVAAELGVEPRLLAKASTAGFRALFGLPESWPE